MIELCFIHEKVKHDVLSGKVFAVFQSVKAGDVNA